MSKIENLIRLAVKTFSHRRDAFTLSKVTDKSASESSNLFPNLLSELVDRASNLTGDDIGLNQLLQYPSRVRVRQKPTALYCGIYETSPLVTVCIFILYPQQSIPLHSHPGMYGVLKLVHGRLLIKSYTSLKPVNLAADVVPNFEAAMSTVELDQNCPPAVLAPDKHNLHEVINTSNDFAVCVDVISPRYENDNCYFQARKQSTDVFEISQIPCPSTFHTIHVPFPLANHISIEDLNN